MIANDFLDRERARICIRREMERFIEEALHKLASRGLSLAELSLEVQEQVLPLVTRVMRQGKAVCVITGSSSPDFSQYVIHTEWK